MTVWIELLAALGQQLELSLTDEQVAQLSAHGTTLFQLNHRLNLTSLTSPAGIVQELFGDSLLMLRLADSLRGQHVVDIGSGGGFPGLPLAVARLDWTVELLERKTSIALFLEQAVQATGVNNATVLNVALEDYPRHRQETGPICFTAKAVFHVEQLCALLTDLGRPLDQACWFGLPGLTGDTLPPPWQIEAQIEGTLGLGGRPTAVYLLSRA